MTKSGYDQFFKQAKKNAPAAKSSGKTISIEQLRNSVSQRNKKPKRHFPLGQFVVFILCALGLFVAVENMNQENLEKFENALQNIEIGIGLAQAETQTSSTTPPPSVQNVSQATAPAAPASEDAAHETDELERLYKFTERKKELDLKEEEIAKKAKEIESQKNYVEQKLKELEEYRSKISNMLQDRVKADAAKIENLVQIYSNMRPGQAAKVFETMDEDLVIEILAKMKKKTAADVLNLMKAEKAQLFAERYAGYRMPAGLAQGKTDAVKDVSPQKETITEPEGKNP